VIHADDGPSAARVAGALAALAALPAVASDPAAAAAFATIEASLIRSQVDPFRFQTRLLESIANGVITLDPDRTVSTFNRAAESTFKIGHVAFVGSHADRLERLMPELPDLVETFFLSGAVQLRAEIEAQTDDGRTLTLEVRFSPLDFDHGVGAAVVISDVTAQRALERAHAAEKARTKAIEQTFSRYLAPHIVASLIENPDSIRLGGERIRATVLFADVRGFTSMVARLEPERVVAILNGYFEEAVRIVFDHDGLLDKFYGDGMMAVFGPPRVRGDDARRALAAAIDLHTAVAELAPKLDYPLEISVGIATGDVVAGHFGSTRRMEYTVIGDAANLAQGLQAAAPPCSIYCDETTIAAAGDLGAGAIRLAARIKNRDELVTAYGLFPPDSALASFSATPTMRVR
jgi:adenylate cyclase